MLNAERQRRDVIVIGGSAGGLEALFGLLERLPRDLSASIAVVLHRSPTFKSELVDICRRRTSLRVREPTGPEPFRPGHLYLAPPDQHMLLTREGVQVNREPKQHWMRPAIDPLFVSAADVYGKRVAGVLVSGGGADGVRGLVAITRAGGLSLVQAPGEARNPSMPMRAIQDDDVDGVLPVKDLALALSLLARGEPVERPAPAA